MPIDKSAVPGSPENLAELRKKFSDTEAAAGGLPINKPQEPSKPQEPPKPQATRRPRVKLSSNKSPSGLNLSKPKSSHMMASVVQKLTSSAFVAPKKSWIRGMVDGFFSSKESDPVLESIRAYRNQFRNTDAFSQVSPQGQSTKNIHEAFYLAEQQLQKADNARKPGILARLGILKRSPKEQAELNKKYEAALSQVKTLAERIATQFPEHSAEELVQKLDQVKENLHSMSEKLEETQENQKKLKEINSDALKKIESVEANLRRIDADFEKKFADPVNRIEKMMEKSPPGTQQEIDALRGQVSQIRALLQPESPAMQACLESTRKSFKDLEKVSDEYHSGSQGLADRDPGLKKTGVESFQEVRHSMDSSVIKSVERVRGFGVTPGKVQSVNEKLDLLSERLNQAEQGLQRQAELKSQAEANERAYQHIYPRMDGVGSSNPERKSDLKDSPSFGEAQAVQAVQAREGSQALGKRQVPGIYPEIQSLMGSPPGVPGALGAATGVVGKSESAVKSDGVSGKMGPWPPASPLVGGPSSQKDSSSQIQPE